METKTFFDAWLETQKQLVTNWEESNRKLQDSVKNGAALTDGVNIYKEWLTKQAEITKNATEQAVNNLQSQVAGAAETVKNGSAAANVSDIYNNWLNTQRDQYNKAFENFRSFSAPFTTNNSFANNAMNQVQDFQQQWFSNTQNWANQSSQLFQQWMAPFQNWSKGFNDSTLKDAWNNMTNASAAYTKFYENWAPMYKSMMNNSFSTDWAKNNFNPESFREMMDRTLAWVSPVQAKELFQQYQNWLEVVNNYNKHVYQQFVGNMPENMKNLTPFLLFGNDANNAAGNVFSVYQRAISPLVRLFYPGKESELNDLIAGLSEKMLAYGQKLNELQQHMYTTGAKAWETFLFENADQVKKGVDLGNLQQVFQQWVNKNEEAMLGLFNSETYSKIQGELLDLGLEIRQRFEKMTETLLQPLPIVLRSEADELYTTIYELRKRISALEKQLDNSGAEKETTAKSSKKKTATV